MSHPGSSARKAPLMGLLLLIALFVVVSGVVLLRADANSRRPVEAAPPAADIVYCVDADAHPAADYSAGGLQIANSLGTPLFFIPAGVIAEVPAIPAVDTLIAAGPGSFGQLEIYRLATGQFELTGPDPRGQRFIRVWFECELPAA